MIVLFLSFNKQHEKKVSERLPVLLVVTESVVSTVALPILKH